MIRVDNAEKLQLLTDDVIGVLHMAEKEFEHYSYNYVLSANRLGVLKACFCFYDRKDYYRSVYPDCILLHETLKMLFKRGGFYSFVRYTIDVDPSDRKPFYFLTLWY